MLFINKNTKFHLYKKEFGVFYALKMSVKRIKSELLKECTELVENRYQKIMTTIDSITESLQEESKSSAGDKHETGRAMLQIDRENAGNQLREIEAVKCILQKIDVTIISDYIRLGSLVNTNQGYYFISISTGAIVCNSNTYYCVALHSPIGKLLAGKRKGDTIHFNNIEIIIRSIH